MAFTNIANYACGFVGISSRMCPVTLMKLVFCNHALLVDCICLGVYCMAQVANELIALQMLTLLLSQPTDDSVEVAVNFVKECGQFLLETAPKVCLCYGRPLP